MDVTGLRRREWLLGAAGLGLSSCAQVRPSRTILVNLADTLAPPAAAPDHGASLAIGSDMFDRLTVAVRINGRGPYSFVVDTGANRTVVCNEVAAELGLPDAGMAEVHGIAGAEMHPTASVALLEVDAVNSRSIRAPTLPRERLGADGLLGVDVLRNRLVTMDFRRQRLHIGPARRQDDARTPFDTRRDSIGYEEGDLGTPVVVPAQYRYGQLIIVAADVRGRPVKAFLDSGSQSTVANMLLNQIVLNTPDPHAAVASRLQTQVLSVTGQTAEGEVGALPPLRIGGLTIANMHVVFADLHVFDLWRLRTTPAILIGIDVMRRFNALQLDFAAREVLFYPRYSAATLPRGL